MKKPKSLAAASRTAQITVRDRKGTTYQLIQKIGRGGQGTVWRVKGGNLAAKLLPRGSNSQRELLSQRLAFVRRLDLQGLSIAKPLETLDPPYCGYVMQFLRDMMPVSRLFSATGGQELTPAWYQGTGGVKRRLRLMASLARLMARIHARGLIYGDLSPENAFISESSAHNEVWLIDADNLDYQSQPSGSKRCPYTPGYGAPEVVNGTGCTTSLSDNYSFAILCFRVLSLVHPFLGDHVNDGEPELEEAAFAGGIPWIEDPEHDLNRTGHGVPRQWVLSPRVRNLFERTFGDGRTDRTKRPSAAEWADTLEVAANSTLTCPKCSGSFYFNQRTCPYCKNPAPSFCQSYLFLWDPKEKRAIRTPQRKPKLFGHSVISNDDPYQVTKGVAYGSEAENRDEVLCAIRAVGERLEIHHPDGLPESVRLLQGDMLIRLTGKQTDVALSERLGSLEMHFGTTEESHYFLFFGIRGVAS